MMRTSVLVILIHSIVLAFIVNSSRAQMDRKPEMEIATLGSGCFWCTEAIFSRLEGVVSVEPGYSGGRTKNPTYQEVCSGNTGHAEVVQVTFDPARIHYAKILEVFFKTHDPTTLNRQGADVGTQYRSVIFYHSPEQKRIAEEVKALLDKAGIWNDPIVTIIEPYSAFYRAEGYHHDYYANNKRQPYCQMVIAPKVEKFEKAFREYLRKNN
jgi:methionine-S-sulfoxide reductase